MAVVGQVMRSVDDIDQYELENRLRQQSEEYVDSINRKGGWVFLEPTEVRERQRIAAAHRGGKGKRGRSGGVRYKSKDLVDPLKVSGIVISVCKCAELYLCPCYWAIQYRTCTAVYSCMCVALCLAIAQKCYRMSRIGCLTNVRWRKS